MLRVEDIDKILDYITNLQEELEEEKRIEEESLKTIMNLEDTIIDKHECIEAQNDTITNLQEENQQLKELTKDKSYCDSCEFKKYFNEKQQEIEKLENDKRGMLVELYKANQRSEYLQRSCERKEEQMLDYRQEYMEQEDYKSRIDKALDYIEIIDNRSSYIDISELRHVYEILKGEDNEENT